MSLFFLFRSRASVVAAVLGAVRPYLMARALDDVDAGRARTIETDRVVNSNGGGSLAVEPPNASIVIRPRRGGIPLG